MIWGKRFVWLHFPKCAGTKIERLFERYFSHRSDIHQDIADVALDPKVSWHDSLAERARRDPRFVVGDRTIICSIRRLPGWLESRYSYEVARSPQLNHDAKRLLLGRYLHVNGEEFHADLAAQRYLPDSVLASPRLVFIRQEHFGEDFRRAFAPFVDVSRIPPKEFNTLENATPNTVPPEISRQLWAPDSELYARCPHWRRVEQLAYPGTATG